jgi:DNA repair exonuclease SbcCD nuclease subunit
VRLLIFSDLHSHSFRPYSEILPNGRNSRLQDILNVLEEIYQTCKYQKIDGVLCGGDLFHARSVLSVATFNDVYEAIAKIRTAVKFFVLTVGNHDQSNKLGTIHSTKTFNAVIDVFDKPDWYVKYVDGESIGIYVIPFTDSKEAIVNAVTGAVATWDDTAEPCPRILLGHFGVSGAEPGANFVLKSSELPVLPDLKPQLFDQIFLGHYHMPQELLPNVRFIGAPLQHNWGDTKQQRGIWLYDTNEDGDYHIPTMIPTITSKFVRIEEDSLRYDKNIAGNFVRAVFKKHLSRDEWAKIKEWLLTETGARWAEEWLELPEERGTSSGGSYTPSMDLHTMVDQYVDDEATENLNNEQLKQLGHEFLEGVMK